MFYCCFDIKVGMINLSVGESAVLVWRNDGRKEWLNSGGED